MGAEPLTGEGWGGGRGQLRGHGGVRAWSPDKIQGAQLGLNFRNPNHTSF